MEGIEHVLPRKLASQSAATPLLSSAQGVRTHKQKKRTVEGPRWAIINWRVDLQQKTQLPKKKISLKSEPWYAKPTKLSCQKQKLSCPKQNSAAKKKKLSLRSELWYAHPTKLAMPRQTKTASN
jgi:hypothetical protein